MRPGRAAFAWGLRDAIGIPALVMAASYLGFGSLVRASGLSLGQGLFSTFSAWALPGQIALVELYAAGASWLAVVTAVALTNLRLLPLVLSLLPRLRHPGGPLWLDLATAHLIAVTSWVLGMRRCPDLPVERRLPYFLGVATLLWGASLTATAGGYLLAGWVPERVSLGLVFVNPIYFLLILFPVGPARRVQVVALCLGGLLGPAFHLLDRDWGLLATGLAAGSIAYLAGCGRRSGDG